MHSDERYFRPEQLVQMHTIPCCDVVNVWLWGAANFTACLVNAKLENAVKARGIVNAIVAAIVESENFIIVMNTASVIK